MVRHGINPVSIRGIDQRDNSKMAIAISRMHIGFGDGPVKKLVSMAAYLDNDTPSEENIRAFLVADEDHFVSGLLHLFPHGEADQIEKSPAPQHEEMVNLLKLAVSELSGNTAEKIQNFLDRAGV